MPGAEFGVPEGLIDQVRVRREHHFGQAQLPLYVLERGGLNRQLLEALVGDEMRGRSIGPDRIEDVASP